ncbi:MAG: enoyl-CoA hydratase/isomerase family protein [Pseudomonadales bacterium]|jgi:enoyl-CoA hydratase/carnithine racemase|nr:enoyl-CoA hydratase/isomerase family protein [Pseudomonadales bacterium]MBP7909502.1 enoyl-CoA hydratase/isomerase family protein [Pseudomonadales bacterium]
MDDVLCERDGAVAVVTLNRPAQLNTISQPMLSALSQALLACEADPEVRAVLLTGAGKAFCAGLDLKDAASEDGVARGGFALAPTLDLRDFPPVVLHAMDTPVICAINGGAAGFGLDLALGCDIRICAAHARLSLAFTRRGVLPETGGTWLLPRLIGWSRAAEIVFSGRTLEAAEALELGLVSRVTEADTLLAAARGLAAEICACAPLAVQAAKRMMRAGLNEGFAEHIQRVYLQTLPLLQTGDFQEGFRSFLERREPRFEGR